MNHMSTIDTIRELGLADAGNSHAERIALLTLAADNEPVMLGLLAERIGMSKGAMTSIADRLVSGKHAKRLYNHGNDRRVVWIQVTKAGLQAVARAERKAGVAPVA